MELSLRSSDEWLMELKDLVMLRENFTDGEIGVERGLNCMTCRDKGVSCQVKRKESKLVGSGKGV